MPELATVGLSSARTIYTNDLRDKTLRGLEGRALAGFATGGVAFGYRLSKESGPDGKSIGTKIDINDAHAAVLRRTFTLYVGGNSFAAIAKTLNAEKSAAGAGSFFIEPYRLTKIAHCGGLQRTKLGSASTHPCATHAERYDRLRAMGLGLMSYSLA